MLKTNCFIKALHEDILVEISNIGKVMISKTDGPRRERRQGARRKVRGGRRGSRRRRHYKILNSAIFSLAKTQ